LQLPAAQHKNLIPQGFDNFHEDYGLTVQPEHWRLAALTMFG
jgi:hypothetical protein